MLLAFIILVLVFRISWGGDRSEGYEEKRIIKIEDRVEALEKTPKVLAQSKAISTTPENDWLQIISTISTFAAVCLSLWLARSERRVRIVVESYIDQESDLITLAVTNIGRRNIVIKEATIYQKRLFFKKEIYKFIIEKNTKLEDGDFYEKVLFKESLDLSELYLEFSKFDKFLYFIRFLKFTVTVKTSTNKQFHNRIKGLKTSELKEACLDSE